MATDAANQHLPVIAKDILIAALQAGKVDVEGDTAEAQGENLATMYNAILKGMRQRSETNG